MENYSIVERQFVDIKTNTMGAGVSIIDNTQTEEKKVLLLWLNFIDVLIDKMRNEDFEELYQNEITAFNMYQKKKLKQMSKTIPEETVQLALQAIKKNMRIVLKALEAELAKRVKEAAIAKKPKPVYLN